MANSADDSRDHGRYGPLFDDTRTRLGLPNAIDRLAYQNILDVFEFAVSQYHLRPAFSCLGHTLSFDEVDRLSSEFAAFLIHHCQLQAGDRLAVQLPNVLQYPVAVFGAIKAGVIIVNTNPLYTPHEMQHQFSDSGAVAVVVLANMANKVQEILPDTFLQHVIVTDMADLHSAPKRHLLNFAVRHIKRMVPPYHLPEALTLREALAIGREQLGLHTGFSFHRAQAGDVAVLQYTGGTTGIAKGAMLTHGNLVANMLQVSPHIELIGIEKGKDIFVAPLPLYHIYAFMLHNLMAFSLGGHSILIPNPRDIPGLARELNKYPFHIMVGLNTLFIALMGNAQFNKLDFRKLKTTLSGGMALSESVAREWQQMTRCAIQEGYGLTEASPVVSLNPAGHTRVGTIGVPLPATYIKIVDDHGKECAEGVAGELCVQGPQVMKGYWQRPEATAEVMRGGWLLTGDVAVVLPDGYVRIVDRKKDMILVSGFNVYPNELENVVNAHPDVLESTVIGVPDEHSGEAVKLFVVRKTEALTGEALQAWCAESLTGYKRPKYIEFTKELPKSNVGKILRRELRDRQGGGHGETPGKGL
jgi:long-chain acyl-CoA synthetase